MDQDTLDLLRVSLRHLLSDDTPSPIAERLATLGWDDVVADDEVAALTALFELHGETLSTADVIGTQAVAAMSAATGRGIGSVVLPLRRGVAGEVIPGGDVEVDGVALGPAPSEAVVAVPTARGVAEVPLDALETVHADPFDSSLHLVRVRGTVQAGQVRWLAADAGPWTQAQSRLRWMLAAELVAIARHVLAEAVAYTSQRVQYGKAIGTFQALQHRVAAAHPVVVGAGQVVSEAAQSGDPWAATVAKSIAGHAAELACTQAQQCYGAIGFTWEHPFHRYLRRTYLLDSLCGDWRTLEFEIGTTLQATRVVPKIGSL